MEFIGVDEVFCTHDGRDTHWISFRYKVLVDRDFVINGEPEKHSELQWVRLDSLPTPLHSQTTAELEKYKPILER